MRFSFYSFFSARFGSPDLAIWFDSDVLLKIIMDSCKYNVITVSPYIIDA